ncbi:uncharacterized protein LOC123875853 [Maniola jurtina]|uniref:uncharacterized protein LOC123875853 n=1 Tax=Maniola jurtina TaxID=191418 RepID=UPI001E686E11|nr:uncharacterized protein LOC123875853 [Maniola jurtina]
MKLFVVFALCVAAASAFVVPPTVTGMDAAEIQEIIDSIYHPSTDPATAAALEQMLLEILGINKPVNVEEDEIVPIELPAIIDESIIVQPGQNEELTPIDTNPAIIDESIVSEPANYRPALVQVIVNVNTNAPGNAVVVEQPEQTIVVDNPEVDEVVVVDQPEVDEVVVVDQPEVDEVVVVDQPEIPEEVIVAPVIIPEEPVEVPTPVIVSPIETIPAINIPEFHHDCACHAKGQLMCRIMTLILKMKYFVVFALCVAAASAFVVPPTVTGMDVAEIQEIIDSIYHPSTDPATAAALEQMLLEILGINKPVNVEENEIVPIDVGPAIIDESIIVEPGQNEELTPIDTSPAIIDESIVSEPANYRPPLVQVIVNVNANVPGNAVVVEQPEQTIVVDKPEVEDVVAVDMPEVPEEIIVAPVIIPEEPVEVPTPVIVAPIETIPAGTFPGIILN